ncbi:hypothetical protein GCM10009094_41210 [Massilia aurea]
MPIGTPTRPVADLRKYDMARTTTKAQLLALLHDLPDTAEIFVMGTKASVQKAVNAASNTQDEDVFMKIASTNVLREANSVSLIIHVD